MIEEDVRSVLLADSAVAGLVGEKVYLLIADEKAAAPYITFQNIIATRETTLVSGAGRTRRARIQFDCWAPRSMTCKQIVKAVSDALVASTLFKAVYLSDQDDYDAESKLCRVALEFSISQTDQ